MARLDKGIVRKGRTGLRNGSYAQRGLRNDFAARAMKDFVDLANLAGIARGDDDSFYCCVHESRGFVIINSPWR